MIRYTVVWDDSVQTPFAEAWNISNSETRAILREIADWIDTTLARDAEKLGKFQADNGTREVAVPLTASTARVTVTFVVMTDDRLVRVVLITFSAPLS